MTMTQHSVILPRTKVPNISFELAGGGQWSLTEQSPENFTMIVFYRGYHCPICKGQLQELQKMKNDFADAGVDTVAISSNGKDLAVKTKAEWQLDEIDLGYGLPLREAVSWGLHLSDKREGTEEPETFSEPGLFLIRPDGTLYFSSIQTMPFARPALKDVLSAVKFVVEKNYPARGEKVTA